MVGRTSPPQVVKPEAGKIGQQHRERGEQHDAGPEVGHRLAGNGQHVDAEFTSGVCTAGHPHAQRDRDDRREQDGGGGKGQRVREPFQDHRHGRGLEGVGRSQVAAEELANEDQVLLEERGVESELRPDRREFLVGGQRPGKCGGRVTRCQADQQEHHGERQEDRQQSLAQSFGEIREHF